VYVKQDRIADADQTAQQAVAMLEKLTDEENPLIAASLDILANLSYRQNRHAEAEALLDRAIALREKAGASPGERSRNYDLRAQLAWKQGRQSDALADLRQAISLAEQQRGHASGAEHERAGTFAQLGRPFERMVAWQMVLGDVAEAMNAIERGRARSLLDEFVLAGANLELGHSAIEREQHRRKEGELQAQAAALEQQRATLSGSGEKAAAERKRLDTALGAARDRLYEHYRDGRSSNHIYRSVLSISSGPPRLRQVQRSLLAQNTLLLAYLFGDQGGYVLACGPDSARLAPLNVGEADARVLGIDAGPLTARRLARCLLNPEETGVVQQLGDAAQALEAAPKLAALWRVLLPEAEGLDLISGRVRQVLVIPDGPLALLPLETLVVADDPSPRYLLDAGPPILYGPSATVLCNLAERLPSAAGEVQPVLTLANPAYGAPSEALVSRAVPSDLAPQTRYRSGGGTLSMLPYTATESKWVAEGFKAEGIPVARLDRTLATELNLRANVKGRQILHLACHGLADQRHGNFFGALALTPGAKATTRPDDDGFLTLTEIYELDLSGCELAILSACETNDGPHQTGEGVWALSRGFLVAGARRVVASNWLVDDEAAASLIGSFSSAIAKGRKEGQPDYARSLHESKRWVRQQKKWESPFYWGTFVLVGPN
jgi:CHAT domain-containing protein